LLKVRRPTTPLKFDPNMEMSEMGTIMRTAATIVVIAATFAALSLMAVKPEAGVTVVKERAGGAGDPPTIFPLDIMLRHGKDLPLEDWGPVY
jgi:hypothetical protein